MDGLHELLNASEACIVERLALEDAEPDLDLVEPACAGGGEVESDVRMRSKPVLVLLVGVAERLTNFERYVESIPRPFE